MRSMTLTDSAILALAKRPDLVGLIPGLGVIRSTKKCNCSGRNKKVNRDLATVKNMLAGIGPETAATLKQKLGVDQIVFYVRTGDGITKKIL